MYGEKWNSSAPKFAANLGSCPLEPMKVTSSSISSTSSINTIDSDVKGPKAASILEVPAAQFDWNSFGLINPLDGKLNQNKTQKKTIRIKNKMILTYQNNSMKL